MISIIGYNLEDLDNRMMLICLKCANVEYVKTVKKERKCTRCNERYFDVYPADKLKLGAKRVVIAEGKVNLIQVKSNKSEKRPWIEQDFSLGYTTGHSIHKIEECLKVLDGKKIKVIIEVE